MPPETAHPANIDALKERMPDHARDIKLNLSTVVKEIPDSGLSLNQVHGIALASAYATKHPAIISALSGEGAATLSPEENNAAKAAATVMAMNNVYYRFIHLAGNEELKGMPAGLRMNVIGSPGIDKKTFELYSLAVSAINGCGMCIESHVAGALRDGTSLTGVQHCVKIAAVIQASAQALTA